MKLILIHLVLAFSFCPMIALAQMSSSGPAQIQKASSNQIAADPSPNTPEWQLTLEVIRAKSETLVGRNVRLVAEQDAMESQHKQLQESMLDWKVKNEELRQFLKERHGQTDQQLRMEDLMEQIKAKEIEEKDLEKQWNFLQGEASSIVQKIRLKKLKISDLELNRNTEALQINKQKVLEEHSVIENSDELSKLQKKLQQEKDRESSLEKQLEVIKQDQSKEFILAPVDEEQIKLLEQKAQTLRQQKEDLQKRLNSDNNPANIKRYEALMSKKKALEVKIKDFETQLNQLKDPGALAFLRNPRRKETLRQLIEVDTKNDRMRQKIVGLREDLILLRQQVNRLERKLKNSD